MFVSSASYKLIVLQFFSSGRIFVLILSVTLSLAVFGCFCQFWCKYSVILSSSAAISLSATVVSAKASFTSVIRSSISALSWSSLATLLRENGIRAQLHCEEKKFKQKIAYADKLGIPYVIFLGEDEISSGVVACKDMATGEQTKLEPAATVYRIKAGLAEREKGTVIQK